MQNGGQSTLLTLHSTAQQFGYLMVESLFQLWSTVPSQGTTEYTRKTGDPGSRQDTGSWLTPEFMLRQTPLLAMEIRLEVTLTGLSRSPCGQLSQELKLGSKPRQPSHDRRSPNPTW